jgi:uracil-DNA glycosylase
VHCVSLKPEADLAGFKCAVRGLIARNVAPESVIWNVGNRAGLFDALADADAPPVRLPRDLAELARTVVCHRDSDKYAQLYQSIWRVLRGEPHLLEVHSDPTVRNLEIKHKEIRRDLHKMHAFIRFRKVDNAIEGEERFIAWFEPGHYILEEGAGFFANRFRNMVWSILTPIGSIHWDKHELRFGPAGERSDASADDHYQRGWETYYRSTFNPARTNTRLMRAHMPKKCWRNMPETQAISDLVQSASSRVDRMMDQEVAAPRKRNPDKAVAMLRQRGPQSLEELNAMIVAAEPMVMGGTRAVLGEGPVEAAVAFVGEQPGDMEDLEGRPFVGPAGQLFDTALEQAGIDRRACYTTNAVKHFKFEQRGKKRIHKTPTTSEIKHYRWWLMKELEFVRPRLVVALGTSAAMALTGRAISIGRERGPAQFGMWPGFVTIHPSYPLRLGDDEARKTSFDALVADLLAARTISVSPPTMLNA